ncbi:MULTISPECIES: FecR domain-containing protein [unclassified Achromobacter]|uniref:FecR domain-containing protein n=1 Tax=unclassified Achromobacter TaxID=2626865 RepID=UPI000B51C13A|nr:MULTISPECIES: FecR domain-containing protein [unclassified Achromobacter]OWT71559.1 histidine kinase [Achromobacter sp. HZ34]OWT73216.1 histidine kinase [Achromobacter sp. HZ28]
MADVIAEHIVEQAVHWYVRLASGLVTVQERADFDHWRALHPDHAQAWNRLQDMGGRLQDSAARVAPPTTHATLARLALLTKRRRALKQLAWLGAGGTCLFLVQKQVPWRGELLAALADVRTGTGERRSLVLADGTQLRVNTATAVDLRFDAQERRLVLRRGEIMIATAKDAANRPFVVATADGELVPVGTRFTVRRDDDTERPYTQLAVMEGAVDVHPGAGGGPASARIPAGQQVRLTPAGVEQPVPLREESQAWIDGMFVAEGMRLADFLAELSRYRRGHLRCAPEVADLRITGAWPLDGPDATDRILDALPRRLPVDVRRYTRYWVTVAAR